MSDCAATSAFRGLGGRGSATVPGGSHLPLAFDSRPRLRHGCLPAGRHRPSAPPARRSVERLRPQPPAATDRHRNPPRRRLPRQTQHRPQTGRNRLRLPPTRPNQHPLRRRSRPQFAICNSAIHNPQFPILLGNPPFSSLSTNTNAWIARLVRGDDEIRGYIRANGQQLGERKTWLHDDYVKFIRLAQWHVEQAGCRHRRFRHESRLPRQRHVSPHAAASCSASFRTSKSSICTATARRARSRQTAAAMKTSSASTKARRSAYLQPHTASSKGVDPRRRVRGTLGLARRKARGARHALADASGWCSLARRARLAVRSSAGQFRIPNTTPAGCLTELMPVNTPAPVTARDHFVVAFTAEELHRRIQRIPRPCRFPTTKSADRYFHRTRSSPLRVWRHARLEADRSSPHRRCRHRTGNDTSSAVSIVPSTGALSSGTPR